jgi:trk system potassium uptake protein TrkA
MRFVVIGCGRFGAELALRLHRNGHEVSVVDEVASAFDNLHPEFRGRTVHGNVLEGEILERAGLRGADGLAAVTNSDCVNAVVARIARTVFGVDGVVVRNYSPGWLPMHATFGFQVVSSTTWGAERVGELLQHPRELQVLTAGHGEVRLYEVPIPTAWAGRTLGELLPAEGCTPAALTHAGHAIVPVAGTRLDAGDILLLSATAAGIDGLRETLGPTGEP